MRTDGQTDGYRDRETGKHSSDFISFQCHALHWTDNSNDDANSGQRPGDFCQAVSGCSLTTTASSPAYVRSPHHDEEGRLKMREWKMRYGQNCKGGKCRSR